MIKSDYSLEYKTKGFYDYEHACKYVLAQVDDFGSFTNTPSSKVKQSIKNIWMAIMESNSEKKPKVQIH